MHNLRSSVFLAVLAALVVNGAVPHNNPDYALILSRQAPGTPQYECHFNCGSAISGGRIATHCDNSTWVGYYEACLECALEFDIWRLYGNSVSSAASACGLSATPSPSGASESASPSTGAPKSSTAAPESNTAAPKSSTAAPESNTAAPKSSTAAPESSTAAPESSTAAPESTAIPSGSTIASESSSAASPSVTAPSGNSTSFTSSGPGTTTPPGTESGTPVPVPSPTSSVTTGGAPASNVHAVLPLLSVGTLVAIFVTLLGAW